MPFKYVKLKTSTQSDLACYTANTANKKKRYQGNT